MLRLVGCALCLSALARAAPPPGVPVPQNPDAAALWQTLQAPREAERVDGLLVCLVQVGKPPDAVGHALADVITLGGYELGHQLSKADLTLRLGLGGDPTIVARGPRKSNLALVTVPAVTLRRGDRLDFALADEGLVIRKPLGRVATRWDGRLPVPLRAATWVASCVVDDGDDARRRARPRLESLDRELDYIARARVDRRMADLGRPSPAVQRLWGDARAAAADEPSLTAVAAYLGWDAPEVKTRVARLRQLEAAFDAAVAREIDGLRATAPRGPLALGAGRLQLTARAGGVALRWDGDIDCGAAQELLAEIDLVDGAGRFHTAATTLRDAAGHRCTPDDSDVPARAPLRGTVDVPGHATIRLVRLPDGSFARVD